MSTHRISLEIKVNIHVLSKSTGIIISICPCIAKTLQYCIGLQKNIFDPANIEIMQIILGLSWIFFEISFQYTWWPLVPYFWSWVTKKCTCQHFLSQTCETFVLSWLGFLKSSHNFSKTTECCQKCPKMFWQPQAPPKLLKGTVLVCFETVTTQSQYWVPFWNIFVEIVSIEFRY